MSIVFLVLHTEPSKGGLIHLLRELVSELDFSVMCTTRTVRPGEQNGREFTFMSNEEFEDMIANNEFLEYTNIHGNYYGTPRLVLEKARQRSHDILIQVDPTGAAQIKKTVIDAVTIRITTQPPAAGLKSFKEIKEERQPGFSTAQQIPDEQFDYLLVNGSPEELAIKVRQIVVSERLRQGELPPANS